MRVSCTEKVVPERFIWMCLWGGLTFCSQTRVFRSIRHKIGNPFEMTVQCFMLWEKNLGFWWNQNMIDLIMHNYFGIESLQLCLLQALQPFKYLEKTYMGQSRNMESASNLISTEKNQNGNIFWKQYFTLGWTKIDTNTAFFRYLKKNN